MLEIAVLLSPAVPEMGPEEEPDGGAVPLGTKDEKGLL